MLKSWTVGNFKSIGEELVLPLSPITALVGANSSGKSSIIQSILLIKQTLQYATADRPIALNGPLLKLGTFDDVRNVRSEGGGVRIGWEYEETTVFPNSETYYKPRPNVTPWREVIPHIQCLTEFGIAPEARTELSRLQPFLVSTSLTALSGTMSGSEQIGAQLEISRMPGAPEPTALPTTTPLPISTRPQPAQRYRVSDIDIETRASLLEEHPNGEIEAAVVRHFLPLTIGIRFDSSLRQAMQIADAICSLRKSIRFQREFAGLSAPPELLGILQKWVSANQEFLRQSQFFQEAELFARPSTIGQVLDALLDLQRRSRSRPASFPSLQELQPLIAEALLTNELPRMEVEYERPRLIYNAAIQIREYFEEYVLYLGPLRDEPKPLYPLEALGNPTDVGYRGEHTAAVLHLNQYRPITYLSSKRFSDNAIDFATGASVESLRDALVDWLSYMGVIDAILTDDRGKIGHELQVRTPGIGKYHDLTNVGVGVSQVLPIVLMALLAPVGSLLIFEQPELHLHPRVQTRLADFFISMAMSGKQCLLETHSEYLIHRLRRRIAEAPGEQLTSMTKLYFVERCGDTTNCRSVDITRYGAVLDWPADFFDQSQVEAESILMAASAKRAEERRQKKGDR
ncbi:AAA family ATPase [Bradyrhizobium sp. 23AC]